IPPRAAAAGPRLPGRAAGHTGPGRVKRYQTGYAGGRSTTARPKPQVEVETLTMGTGTRWERPEQPEDADLGPADEGPTDIRRIVDSIREAARTAEVPEPRKPWLPTLAPVQDL